MKLGAYFLIILGAIGLLFLIFLPVILRAFRIIGPVSALATGIVLLLALRR
ncbi:MAG: hypothetical protein PUD50_05285 [Eubacteriales bacterium]|nr:hypothetical protein [Eubacteriales bacterium]